MGRRDLGSGARSPLRPVGNHWPIFLPGAPSYPRVPGAGGGRNRHVDLPRSGGAVFDLSATILANWFGLVPASAEWRRAGLSPPSMQWPVACPTSCQVSTGVGQTSSDASVLQNRSPMALAWQFRLADIEIRMPSCRSSA